ncbi:MAG: DUF4287 domain-containing protein [Flavobacteriales bacterium]|nr:DUF4287 domain-containing protein [Flavobacteriales bacterium]
MDKALRTMIDNMPGKTGKSLDEWKILLKQKTFEKHSEAVKFLKSEHNVTHGFANTIVTLSNEDRSSPKDLVSDQYKGKENLLPIYKKLIEKLNAFGEDVTITPKKTTVSIIRKRQFALIKPATKTRVDLGLKLPGKDVAGRLESSGPFGTMCTHRVQISNPNGIDDELEGWLKEAYELSV